MLMNMFCKGWQYKMDTNKFKGIFTALLTPFDRDNKINEKALEALIKFNIENGVKGFYVGGSTAEAFLRCFLFTRRNNRKCQNRARNNIQESPSQVPA